MAFPIVLLAIQRLAKRITTWCAECDRRLVRLFESALYASDHMLQGALSTDDVGTAELHVYPDGDFVGNIEDAKSIASLLVEIAGLAGCTWPIACQSKTELATAAHSQEAEMLSLSIAIRNQDAA